MNLDINTMTLDELKDLCKLLVENIYHEHERITLLQNRILKLEMNFQPNFIKES